MFKFIGAFRHWILTKRLENDDGTMPHIVVIWPHEDLGRAIAELFMEPEARCAVVRNPTKVPTPPIEGIPMETMLLDGVPVTFATMDGKQLVAIRAWKGKKHA